MILKQLHLHFNKRTFSNEIIFKYHQPNMIRNVLFVLFFPFAVTQSDSLPSVLCSYPRMLINLPNELLINDIPNRCEVFIILGNFQEDVILDAADKDVIKKLKKANKKVYIHLSFEDVYNENLIQCIKDNDINGVVIELVEINVPDKTDPMSMKQLINKLKTNISSLTVCVYLEKLNNYISTSQTSVFDFSVINDVLDLYIIEISTFSKNTEDNYPKISTNTITKFLKPNFINPNKVIIYFFIKHLDDNNNEEISLSKYCEKPVEQVSTLSTVPLHRYYDEVTSVKSIKINGILIGYLENDDYDNKCECGKFPVTNTIIAAWYSGPIQTCEKFIKN